MKTILETNRLLLRERTLADLDFIAEMLAHPEVMRYYPKLFTRDETRVWLERQMKRYEKDGHGLWLVVDKETELPVGQVGLILQEVDGASEFEISYFIHRPYWRRGFATEAAIGVRQYAFETLGLNRVISLIRPENVPSQGVARKLDMSPERETIFRGLKHLVFAINV